MAILYPARPILGSPAWLWVVLAVLLFLLTKLIPNGDIMDPALELRPAQRAERDAIASERIIVAREGDSFRFVPVAERHAEREAVRANKKTEPLWSVFVKPCYQDESFSYGASYFLPGLIHKESHWTYVLKANCIDYGWYMEVTKNGIDWKGDKENPFELSPAQMGRLKPLVVAELNRRNPKAKLGDRLKKILDDGLEVSSTSPDPQNALILLRWLALLMTVVILCSMVVRPRPVSIPQVVPMSSDIEVLLIKMAAVRARLKKSYREPC